MTTDCARSTVAWESTGMQSRITNPSGSTATKRVVSAVARLVLNDDGIAKTHGDRSTERTTYAKTMWHTQQATRGIVRVGLHMRYTGEGDITQQRSATRSRHEQ